MTKAVPLAARAAMTAVVEAMEKRILDESGSLRSEKVVLKMVDAVEGTVRVGGRYKTTSGRRDYIFHPLNFLSASL